MATEISSAPSMPQLQSVQKAMAIPTVGAAVGQVGALYTRVKGKLQQLMNIPPLSRLNRFMVS